MDNTQQTPQTTPISPEPVQPSQNQTQFTGLQNPATTPPPQPPANSSFSQEPPQAPTKKINPMFIIIGVVVLILLVVVGLFAPQMMQGNNQDVVPSMIEEEVSEDMMALPDDEDVYVDMGDEAIVQEFDIEAGSFYYEPNVIRVQQGDLVRLNMTSVDMMHDLVIDELGISIPVIQAGGMGSIEFVADQVGEFEYYCSVGSHRAQGQVGTLIVE